MPKHLHYYLRLSLSHLMLLINKELFWSAEEFRCFRKMWDWLRVDARDGGIAGSLGGMKGGWRCGGRLVEDFERVEGFEEDGDHHKLQRC